jgi:hypothetical protein
MARTRDQVRGTKSHLLGLAGLAIVSAGCSDVTAVVVQPRNVTVQVMSTVTGRLALAMSTSFQPPFSSWFFQGNPGTTGPLGALNSQHMRIQSQAYYSPQTSPTTWDFTLLDATTQPVLTVGDHSPEMQLAQGPSFMYDANGNFLDPTYAQFAAYSANIVRYYNTGGFSAPDGMHASPSAFPITWWGIYNEPNINNLTGVQYASLYNATVPAMQSVDNSIKFVAAELAGLDQNYLLDFLGNVTAHIDVVALHFYSTCDQRDRDTTLFGAVPGFAGSVQYVVNALGNSGPWKTVPVWITENNVDAGFNLGNGINACTGQPFVIDKRGSSAFFAAWRPYVFSQVGRSGAHALYQWAYPGDAQYGEVNQNTGAYQLSYWVDYWLTRVFPSPPGANVLRVANNDSAEVEVLAVTNDDGSAAVMIANHAVASMKDNNGAGAPSTVSLDLSALGSFQSANLLILDARTDPSSQPQPASVPFQSMMTVSLPGYGVAFLTLK